MNDLAWLVKHRVQSVTHREFDWLFAFDGQAQLVVGCLWRLLEAGRIRLTSGDDGQRFGLPSPIIAANEVGRRLAGATIESVDLRDGTLDLELLFDNELIIQVLPDSSGYESWQIYDDSRQFIAVGGGKLAVVPWPMPIT